MAEDSKTWTWLDGAWHEGNVMIMGPRTHASWMASSVFDGARAFEGVTPDLELHFERINDSARAMFLEPAVRVGEMMELAKDGIAKFDADAALYIRPMYWAEAGGFMGVPPLPESTRFCLCIYDAPMPPVTGFTATFSSFRRPSLEVAPTNAKAGCLYPNSGRALTEAKSRGFDNAIMCDMLGNVAETATSNIFLVKDGKVATPSPNGSFLAGITRARTISLLRKAGYEVHETRLRPNDFLEADEVFSTGNYSKVVPVTQIDDRDFQPGPVMAKARELYWEFAHG
ncbi:Branched-chain-amino-acid aminotransferase [Hartmannibacter diazotrophicus]|uniref:Probable branched-chain-amino-acid aminotransferase n=1 Tax=Hartmannibacter diazotrophicus TaxID=1482074 RepID=A0A2C9D3K2_9HYPH|nr:branched-chain amino acid aminotransferase [Hartmannibacter diazotrophicus]SON54846.1 Branched-chain-amino-acid aminotransferase [Hartmannibacter diazotrophicus]